MATFVTRQLPDRYDTLAPDQSEIRLLAATMRASVVHCTLPPEQTSLAVTHRSVEEIWFCLSGHGQLWRRAGDQAEIVELQAGLCVTIPTGTHFQFRTLGSAPLCLIIATIPAWPGTDEAIRVADHWPTEASSIA